MSFIDRAVDTFDRSEATLHALIAEALKVKAYSDVAAIEAMAQALARVRRTIPREVTQIRAAAEPETETQRSTRGHRQPCPWPFCCPATVSPGGERRTRGHRTDVLWLFY